MRQSGIIMHLSSLPSPYGIGTMGADAYAFGDFLKQAGVSYWQMLPIGPIGAGNSPYHSYSAFAGNPYFIDLDLLQYEGLLERDDYCNLDWGSDPRRVDYDCLARNRLTVLRKAYERGRNRDREMLKAFAQKNRYWLDDYTLYMSLRCAFGNTPWQRWEEGVRLRHREVMKEYRAELMEEMDFWAYIQFLFFKQWQALRRYINGLGIKIIGDLPIYVAEDSADVWAHGDLFQMDENRRPAAVAGCPPDYFSETGQLWGNPLYQWEQMKRQNYRWWVERLRTAFQLADRVRVDHFRGISAYYSIPAGAKDAREGHWEPGPGIHFFRKIFQKLGRLDLIAEDLGQLDDEVHLLREEAGLPGMAVLQFAFDSDSNNPYLPHNLTADRVLYTGTHDNDTLAGWLANMPPEKRAYCNRYLRLGEQNPLWDALGAAWGSVSELVVAQMQDFLALGSESRMNTPGTVGDNWQWRVERGWLNPTLASYIADLGRLYGRYHG